MQVLNTQEVEQVSGAGNWAVPAWTAGAIGVGAGALALVATAPVAIALGAVGATMGILSATFGYLDSLPEKSSTTNRAQ